MSYLPNEIPQNRSRFKFSYIWSKNDDIHSRQENSIWSLLVKLRMSYDSGTMAYSDYSTYAIARVRASSPAWRYHYNIRLYSIDFRWVHIKFWITSFWGFGRAARSGDAMSQSDYAMSPVSSIQWYFKCNIIDDFHGVLPDFKDDSYTQFRGSGRAARQDDTWRHRLNGSSII